METGYVSTGFGQAEEPIFGVDYVQFQLPANLVDMAVSNNILIVALESYRLLRVDLDNPLEVEEIEISRKSSDGKISKIFFDPTGRHLIITTDRGENYYLFEKWRKTKPLPKFKVSTQHYKINVFNLGFRVSLLLLLRGTNRLHLQILPREKS